MANTKTQPGKKKYKKQSKHTIICILTVMALFCGALFYGTYTLQKRNDAYEAQIEDLNAQKESESAKAEELAREKIRVNTKEYVEEIAKTKLGLVNPGEILLKPNSDD